MKPKWIAVLLLIAAFAASVVVIQRFRDRSFAPSLPPSAESLRKIGEVVRAYADEAPKEPTTAMVRSSLPAMDTMPKSDGVYHIGGAVLRAGLYSSANGEEIRVSSAIIGAGVDQISGLRVSLIRPRADKTEQTILKDVSLQDMIDKKHEDPVVLGNDVVTVTRDKAN